ncbi:MAG: hypothetical protein ACFB4I_09150 [Cyanophyceae cyanobacterium]
MKRIIAAGCGALSLGFSTAVFALEAQRSDSVLVARQNSEVTPYSLVSSGYQGFLKSQGIPSASTFITGIKANKVTATSLINAGIAMGRLSENKLDDRTYVIAVSRLLDNLASSSN